MASNHSPWFRLPMELRLKILRYSLEDTKILYKGKQGSLHEQRANPTSMYSISGFETVNAMNDYHIVHLNHRQGNDCLPLLLVSREFVDPVELIKLALNTTFHDLFDIPRASFAVPRSQWNPSSSSTWWNDCLPDRRPVPLTLGWEPKLPDSFRLSIRRIHLEVDQCTFIEFSQLELAIGYGLNETRTAQVRLPKISSLKQYLPNLHQVTLTLTDPIRSLVSDSHPIWYHLDQELSNHLRRDQPYRWVGNQLSGVFNDCQGTAPEHPADLSTGRFVMNLHDGLDLKRLQHIVNHGFTSGVYLCPRNQRMAAIACCEAIQEGRTLGIEVTIAYRRIIKMENRVRHTATILGTLSIKDKTIRSWINGCEFVFPQKSPLVNPDFWRHEMTTSQRNAVKEYLGMDKEDEDMQE